VQIRADAVGEDYVWCWNTDITKRCDSSPVHVSFRQSTFQGVPLSLDRIRKRKQEFVPSLSQDGRIDHVILDHMAKQVPLEQIARNIAAQFSHQFPSWQEALNRVADLSVKYSS